MMVPLNTVCLVLSYFLALVQATPIRWMPLGESITDYGCWRAFIWQRFQQDGHHDVDIVGSQTSGENCNGLDFDRDQEGHPGFQATNLAAQGLLVDWLRQNPADIVTVHLGTVDILRGKRTAEEILAALGTLIEQMRDSNPAMRIIVRLSPDPLVGTGADDQSRLRKSSPCQLWTTKCACTTPQSRHTWPA
jgi:lysophospholipase L1-like esterase